MIGPYDSFHSPNEIIVLLIALMRSLSYSMHSWDHCPTQCTHDIAYMYLVDVCRIFTDRQNVQWFQSYVPLSKILLYSSKGNIVSQTLPKCSMHPKCVIDQVDKKGLC